MTTFDGWNTLPRQSPHGQLSDDELMHFRTKGSKNGVRRYQNTDGSWTPLGLKERKEREGWGESRKERKIAKKVAREEKHAAKKVARTEAKAARAEERRKKYISKLTDEEMKAKLERARMEAEYRDLKKRGSVIETGTNLIGKYLDYKKDKANREIELNKQKLEMERLKTQQVQAKESTKQSANRIKSSANEAKTAVAKAKQTKADVKGGLKIQREKDLKETKIRWRDGTIHGGVQKKINNILVARGEGRAERIKERAFTSGILRNRKRIDRYNNKLDPYMEKQSYDPNPWDRNKNKPKKK